jgi:four helix bundle protein
MEKLDERTFRFAANIVRLVSTLPRSTPAEVLGRQLVRSGTSVGANIEEAYAATTKRDFTYKLSVALKEARETHYWLRLLRETCILPDSSIAAPVQEANEIKLILAKAVLTSKKHADP